MREVCVIILPVSSYTEVEAAQSITAQRIGSTLEARGDTAFVYSRN